MIERLFIFIILLLGFLAGLCEIAALLFVRAVSSLVLEMINQIGFLLAQSHSIRGSHSIANM